MNYYNEFNHEAAEWLRELIRAGIIPNGHVDERSIADVQPKDLDGFTQCHFFAGIGGWPFALALAWWDSARPVWTGSCPCQPFSVAGKRKGTSDERHLWPEMYRLIRECKPSTVFGEQVAGPDALRWFDGVSTDLENKGYAVAAADLCAASVGAPHIRQRLYWVADMPGAGLQGSELESEGYTGKAVERGGIASGLADAKHEQYQRSLPRRRSEHREDAKREADEFTGHRDASRLVQPNGAGCKQGIIATEASRHGRPVEPASGANAWSNYDIIQCLDGKARRVESKSQSMVDGLSDYLDALRTAGASEAEIIAALCSFPLVQGAAARAMLLKGYGNAIVPELAAEFVMAFMEA